MRKGKKTVTPTSILEEIQWIIDNSKYHQSRQSGKRFYDPRNLPSLLASYVQESAQTLKANARYFGMSPDTLARIVGGGPLSENMLFRIRSAVADEVSRAEASAVFLGDWREASSEKVAAAISDVSKKLVYLKRVIESSNFLKSENSPIDKIQVLQLIALLTAMLEALKAPFVDKKRASGFFRWLSRLAKTSAEKGVEKLVVDAMGDAANAGADFINNLSSQSGTADLGNIIT